VNEKSELQARIESGKQILVAEISPPKSGDPSLVQKRAKAYAGNVLALGVSDNRHGASMAALAAATLAAREGVEPILHVVTRDHNRIVLVSECLGAQALGIRNFLCVGAVDIDDCESDFEKTEFPVTDCELVLSTASSPSIAVSSRSGSLNSRRRRRMSSHPPRVRNRRE